MLIYTQLLILLFIFLTLYVNLLKLQEYTLTAITAFIINYCSQSNQFLLLFLLLSGLPPVSFFLIKLSFLIKIFSSLSLTIQFLFFLNFLLGMLFYLQIFNVTLKNFYQTDLLLKSNTTYYAILVKNTINSQEMHYNYWFMYSVFMGFNILSILFYFDLYIIFFSFFN